MIRDPNYKHLITQAIKEELAGSEKIKIVEYKVLENIKTGELVARDPVTGGIRRALPLDHVEGYALRDFYAEEVIEVPTFVSPPASPDRGNYLPE